MFFPIWKPRIWNGFCLRLNNTDNSLFVNNEFIASKKEQAIFWHNISEIVMMSSKGSYQNSLFGAMTDVNIWNRTLSDVEVKQFQRCGNVDGSHVGWSPEILLHQRGLSLQHLGTDQACPPSTLSSVILGNSRNIFGFDQTIQFCSEAFRKDKIKAYIINTTLNFKLFHFLILLLTLEGGWLWPTMQKSFRECRARTSWQMDVSISSSATQISRDGNKTKD